MVHCGQYHIKKEACPMFYRCTDPDCRALLEEERRPDRCPHCGRAMRQIPEEQLDGRDWAMLGNLWLERGEIGRASCRERV